MNKTKKVKGSAFTDEEGRFIFTPFAPQPESNKNLTLVRQGVYTSLWLGKNTISVRMSFERKFIPPYQVWVEEMTLMYNTLMLNLNSTK